LIGPRSARGLAEDALHGPSWTERSVVLVLAGLAASALAWSAVSEIDIRARGTGQVVTASATQVVQHLEGGIVTEIKVKNGDHVKRGQLLVRLSPTNVQGELKEIEAQSVGLLAAAIRLEAEATGRDPVFPAELRKRAATVVKGEEALHELRLAALQSQLDVLEAELREKRSALQEFEARVPTIRETMRMITTQEAEIRHLVESNAASPQELIQLQKEYAQQKIQLTVAQESIPGARAAVAAAQRRVKEKRTTFAAEAQQQLTENRTKFMALQGTLESRKEKVQRTVVTSPVDGVVKTMHVTTVGEVVAPGRTIAEIVPIGDSLEIEARISPNDIGFVTPGQPVDVRLSAFDYAIYGSLHGKVARISPDTVRDEADPRLIFYRVMVQTDRNYLQGRTGKLSIMPGMLAEVDIQTGRRTVLDYFLKPLTRAQATALRER
jgi:adhesin transport system membrane fusion protein